MTTTRPARVTEAAVPEKVDLREFLWPVESTGEILCAPAAAFATALEYHCNRTGESPTDLSTLFIYYNARKLAGTENENVGTSMADVIKAVATFGACREESWPLDPVTVTTAPPAKAYEEGKRLPTIQLAHPVDVFQALSLRYPLPFALFIPQRCIDEAWKTGVVPPLTKEELARLREQPAHAMVLVGYDKSGQTFTVRNCFGAEFGEDGHCQISFELFKALVQPDWIWLVASPQASEVPNPAVASRMTPSAAPQPGTVAEMAARMRAEIRGDLQRDLADAAGRVRDRVTPKAAAPMGSVGTRGCSMCQGKGHWNCGGRGCAGCNYSGNCPNCS